MWLQKKIKKSERKKILERFSPKLLKDRIVRKIKGQDSLLFNTIMNSNNLIIKMKGSMKMKNSKNSMKMKNLKLKTLTYVKV